MVGNCHYETRARCSKFNESKCYGRPKVVDNKMVEIKSEPVDEKGSDEEN